MDDDLTCEQCRFWDRIDHTGAGLGRCRRHAPSLAVECAAHRAYWPMSEGADWCGEGESK